MNILGRLIFTTVVLAAIIPFTPLFTPTDVHASCIAQPENGNWVNVSSDFGGGLVSSIKVHASNCEDQNPHPDFYVDITEAMGKDLGTVDANRQTFSGQIYAEYDYASSVLQAWIYMSKQHPGYLRVDVLRSYPDSGITTSPVSYLCRKAP